MRRRRLYLLAAGTVLALSAGGAALGMAPTALGARCAVASRSAAAAGESSFLGKAADLVGGGFGAVTDRFSIGGKDGPYACSTETIARQALDAAKLKAMASTPPRPNPNDVPFESQVGSAGATTQYLLAMPKTRAELQAIVDDIARAWPYQPVRAPRVLISAEMDYNAHAYPDGTIVVSIGVFLGPDGKLAADLTDSDLYFLLGHEFAHHALDHFRSLEVNEGQRKFVTSTMLAAERGVQLASSINYAQAAPNLPVDLKDSYQDAETSSNDLRFMMNGAIYPVFGREREDEADAAGMDAAFLAGRMPTFSYSIDQFEATEKTAQQRIETAQANMKARGDKVLNDPRFGSAVKQGDMAGSFGTLVDNLKKSVYESFRKFMIEISGRNHRAAKARRDGITRYLQTAYVKAELLPQDVEVLTTRVDRMRASEELAEGLTVARALLAADDALIALPKDRTKAAAQVAVALKSPLLGNGPYVRYKAHQVALANGDTAGAIAHLEVARKHPDAAPVVYRELIRLLARAGRLPQARAVLAEGRKRYTDKAYFLPSDILFQVRSRQYDDAKATLAACKATNRDGVILDCKAAALDVDYKETPPADQQKLKGFGWATDEAPVKRGIPGLPGGIKPRLPWGG